MVRRTRTILFIVCVFLFILAAPLIILYSQGYRFDFNPPAGGKRIVQTGAFYFKAVPRSAEVYLGGKLKETTSFLSGSLLIENLLPKTYEIEIKKDGYHSWQKKLAVKEKQVSEAKNIVLFPKNPNFTIIDQKPEVEISATSSDKNKVVQFNDYEIWVHFLQDQYGQPQKKAGDKLFLTRFSEKIGNVFWLTNHYLIFNAGNKIKIVEIDDRDKINIIELADVKNPEVFWDKKEKKLYVLTEGNLFALENLLP